MKKMINFKLSRSTGIFLGLLPFILLLFLYMISSEARLAINSSDKLLPSFEQIGNAIHRMAFEPSKRTGEYLLWVDTASSLTRLALGVLIAAILGLIIGLLTGALPIISSGFSPFLTVFSLVPPLTLLPVLFIVFGLGELSKVILIAVGITPFIARDIQRRTLEIPDELIVKAQTLGANTAPILNTQQVEVAVCGAHLEGLPLNWQLTERKATFIKQTKTANAYRMYALAGGPPHRPGIIRDTDKGAALPVEIWSLPTSEFGDFVRNIPAPLGIGQIELEDGSWVCGFICEPYVIHKSEEITHLGGWKEYLKR